MSSGVFIIFEHCKNITVTFSHLVECSETRGYMAQSLSACECLEKRLPNSSGRFRILSSNQLAIHNDLGLYFKGQPLDKTEMRMITPHGSAAFSYLPPSNTIFSSGTIGISYWGPCQIQIHQIIYTTCLDFLDLLFFYDRERCGPPLSKDGLSRLIHDLRKGTNQ
jgi:hypothetical protein